MDNESKPFVDPRVMEVLVERGEQEIILGTLQQAIDAANANIKEQRDLLRRYKKTYADWQKAFSDYSKPKV